MSEGKLWYIERDPTGDISIHSVYGSKSICWMPQTCPASGPAAKQKREVESNAHLIAAAPELLEACENWVELIERTARENKLFLKLYANSEMDFHQGLAETRAAIRKARGEG